VSSVSKPPRGGEASPKKRPQHPEFDPIPEEAGKATILLHAGRRPERNAGAVVAPIFQTSTFHFPSNFSESSEFGDTYLYTRNRNPMHEVLEEKLRRVEGGESARVFGSGMGAITTTLLSLLKPGDEIVALEDLYGGTLSLLQTVLPKFGIRVRWVPHEEAGEPERLVGPGTRLVHLETPTSPLLRVHDIRRWADATHRSGALLSVDNTFATPINQNPIPLGADLVVHSATKYLGGHHDLLAGAVIGRRELIERIDPRVVFGSVLDPLAAFLLDRGMKTLALRVERQNETGRAVAESLVTHPKVEHVYYPGHNNPTDEEIARRQMRGRGGVVSVSVKGGLDGAHRFLKALRLVHVASSLGGVETLASLPVETSHVHLKSEELASRGIAAGLVRLSVGLEEPEDILRDLRHGLDAA